MIDLTDPRLFGNDAADDEDPEILAGYFVDKKEFKGFRSRKLRFSIAQSRKGVGKSALLAYTAYAIGKGFPDDIIVEVKGKDLVSLKEAPALRPDVLIFDWQQRVCTAILHEIGTSLSIALSDDSMSIVEAAEVAGFRKRNIIGALIDRLKPSLKLGAAEATPQKAPVVNPQRLLARYMESGQKPLVWVFIDDIDATFIDSADERLRLSTFFSAMRNLAADVEGLLIRTCVRSDVWTLIRATDEALDKVQQYSFDIAWEEDETLAILANRVRSYIQQQGDGSHAGLLTDTAERQKNYVERVFMGSMQWGTKKRPPHVVVDTLSHGRPRWAIQLCRMAAETAAAKGNSVISLEDITENLTKYGSLRVDDIKREHQHQCPQVSELLDAFVKQPARYETGDLIKLIKNRILEHFTPVIDGRRTTEAVAVAQFLFRIGFLTARDDLDDESYRHFKYEELPHLLKNRSNLDYGYSWEIHPCFRQHLQLQGYLPHYERRKKRRGY